jgi:hypothetical protein
MIDKILDKYYARKVVWYLMDALSVFYIDKKIVKTKNHIGIWVKERKLKDKYYEQIYNLRLENSVYNLLHIDDLVKEIKEEARNYLKKEK